MGQWMLGAGNSATWYFSGHTRPQGVSMVAWPSIHSPLHALRCGGRRCVPSMVGALALVCWFAFFSWRLLGCPSACELIPAIQVLRWFLLLLWVLTMLVFLGLACWSSAGHKEQAASSEDELPPPSGALPQGHVEGEVGQTSAGSSNAGSPRRALHGPQIGSEQAAR